MAYFIFGILFIQFGLPILESLTAVILTGLEALKGYFGIQVTKFNRKMVEDEDIKPMQKIDFCFEEEENDE